MNVGFRVPTKVDAEPRERTLDLRQYVNFIWRNWMFIASGTGLAFLVGVVDLVRAIPLYTASTQVLLEQQEKPPGLEPVADDGRLRFDDYSYVANQLVIIRSDSLLQRVVIKDRPVFAPSVKKAQNSDAPQGDPTSADEQWIHNGINQLRGALTVSRSGTAQVLNIAITWDDPDRAATLANAVADAYVVDQLDARLEAAKRASGWLSDRIVELRKQLRDSEEAVAKFRQEHGLTRSGPTVALNDQQLADLNSKLIAARTDAAEKKAQVDFLADLAAGKKSLESLPDSLQSKLMGTLRGKLADVSQREADLLARYSRSHPAVVNVEAEKRDVERSIAAETQRMAETVQNDYALAKARLDAIQKAMNEATGQGEINDDDQVRLRELERTAAVDKTLFEDFLQKAKITNEQTTFRAQDVRVLMPAQRGGQTFPDRRKVLLTALLAGLGLGVVGAFAMEMLKAGFTSAREVEEALGVHVLASVPQLSKSQLIHDGKKISVFFYQVYRPLSTFSESMRTLRNSILMSDVDQPPKVIHVTSAVPGEGKTTIAVNLATAAAFAGLKVVLVDADLRRPQVSRSFKLQQKKGLVDLLIGATTVDKVLSLDQELKLFIIPAGSESQNPTDLLGSDRMKALVSQLKETFDYIVMDTPPVGPVFDPVIVANLVDKTIFVIKWASTPRGLIETSLQRVSTHKRVPGVVFNYVDRNRARKYDSEYSYAKQYEQYYSG